MNSYGKIFKVLKELSAEIDFSLEIPDDVNHGDFATNIAFILSKKEGVSPKECAEKLVPKLKEELGNITYDISVAGAGFINFFLKDNVVQEENNEIKKIETKFSNKDVLVEHSSPNLFKPFSVGHLMNNIIGEFVTRATKEGGANTKTMSFPSDYSLGIAKAMYIVLKDKKDMNYFSGTNEDEVIKYLGDAYVRGVKECEENKEALDESKKILDKMYTLEDETFHELFVKIRSINESYFKKVLGEIGSVIDNFQYESWAGKEGKDIVLQNVGKVFKESEGAIIYEPDEERKDLNVSVFINSQGYPTYEAKDLGLLKIKFNFLGINNFSPELSYFITDAEQIPHFKVVLDSASKLGGEWPLWVSKSKHIPHGRMLFKGQKMSSRLGGVPLALDVIGTVEEEVRERSGDKISHLNQEDKKKLEREIALSALRISVLRSKPGLNINFDPDSSLSFEGDSGPYLLYTHARASSLFDKLNIESKWSDLPITTLEKTLSKFEIVLTQTIEELSPQKLVTYLFKVSQDFNRYYSENQIIVDGDENGNAHRLKIVSRTKEVLKKGLYVLGIEAPDRM